MSAQIFKSFIHNPFHRPRREDSVLSCKSDLLIMSFSFDPSNNFSSSSSSSMIFPLPFIPEASLPFWLNFGFCSCWSSEFRFGFEWGGSYWNFSWVTCSPPCFRISLLPETPYNWLSNLNMGLIFSVRCFLTEMVIIESRVSSKLYIYSLMSKMQLRKTVFLDCR